jgi:hypothetical protein
VGAVCISDTAVRTILKMPGNDGDGTRASTSQPANGACKRCAFDVLSSRPRKVSKPTKWGRALAGSSGSNGRPYAWYSLTSIIRSPMASACWTELRCGPNYRFHHDSVPACSVVWERITEGGLRARNTGKPCRTKHSVTQSIFDR